MHLRELAAKRMGVAQREALIAVMDAALSRARAVSLGSMTSLEGPYSGEALDRLTGLPSRSLRAASRRVERAIEREEDRGVSGPAQGP